MEVIFSQQTFGLQAQITLIRRVGSFLSTLTHQNRRSIYPGVRALQAFERFPRPRLTQRQQQRRPAGRHLLRPRRKGIDPPPGFCQFLRRQLGQDESQHLRLKVCPRLWCGQKLVQLLLDALCRYTVEVGGQLLCRRLGGFVDGKAEPGRKAVEPQDAQGVLPEAAQRLTDRPHHAPGKVFPPAEGVTQTLLGAVGHRIDGEVPPGQILPEVGHKGHAVGVTAIGIAALGAKGGDLIQLSIPLDGDGAVLQAGGDAPVFSEQLHHLPGAGRGAEVPVVGRKAQQAVPDTAAHGVGPKACPVQLIQKGGGTGFQNDVHSPSSSY